jgi:putative Ca2+/H+ antiporter (TMEM165/GDT1 family)
MDWKIFFITFWTIFLAEIADKTQLASIGIASRSGKPFSVLLGSVAGYIAITGIAVLFGVLIHKYIKPDFIRQISALLFIVIGILIFFKKI